jgi:hypothetical protein
VDWWRTDSVNVIKKIKSETNVNFTPQGAFDYIKSKLDDFYARGDTLAAQETAMNQLSALYEANSLDTTELYQTFGEINDELLSWQRIANMLTPILGYFGYTPPSTLGIDPFTLAAIAGTLIAVAALLWSWYNSSRIDAHATAIRTLAQNVPLSPTDQAIVDQATTSPGFFSSIFSGLGTVGNYLLIGGGIYLAILLLRK